MFKNTIVSLNDLRPCDHVLLGNDHYLIKWVNSESNSISAYTLNAMKQVTLLEDITHTVHFNPKSVKVYYKVWGPNTIAVLECSQHSRTNVAAILKQVEEELKAKSKWVSSDCFVTAMRCGVEHSIVGQSMISPEAAPKCCTLITPCSKASVVEGDHLVLKGYPHNLHSVIVHKCIDDTKFIVRPPLDEGEIVDLTTFLEVYRVDYSECLQAEETLKNVHSHIGQRIFHSCGNCTFAVWAKTRIERCISNLDILKYRPSTEQHTISCKKVTSLENIKPGDHLFECHSNIRRHIMVTERESSNIFKVILCQGSFVFEERQMLSCNGELFQITYHDCKLHYSADTAVRRARSYLGQQIHNPWAHVLFIKWAKIEEVDTIGISPSRPVSKSKIRCFTQLIPGDYLVGRPLNGLSHHYLVITVDSTIQCTAVECFNGKVTQEQLSLNNPDKFPLFYRINYKPGTCLPREISIHKAQTLIGGTKPTDVNFKNFIHLLKTEKRQQISVDRLKNINELKYEDDHSSSKVLFGAPQFIQPITSPEKITDGDHIMYNVRKPPFRPDYCSAIVLEVIQNQKLVIVTKKVLGVVKETVDFDSLLNVHQVVYLSYYFPKMKAIDTAKESLECQESNYDKQNNNSHHFITRCKCGYEYPLTEHLRKLELLGKYYI